MNSTAAGRLAANLAAIRDKRGMNTKQFVEATGLPKTVLHRLLNQLQDPRLSTIEQAAKGLGTTPSKLIQ